MNCAILAAISAYLELHKAFQKPSTYLRVYLRFFEILLQHHTSTIHPQESLNSGLKKGAKEPRFIRPNNIERIK